ncbi:hypothetical protein SBA3_2360001 [Candidatus Sulfopaludibacter sp. SbA3]|nr:hypothetical protein SBA3_2360001 [Candidatus Sulfopaludibacter sp. SbA3]
MTAKLAASIDLLLGQVGLLSGEETRSCLALYGMREAVIYHRKFQAKKPSYTEKPHSRDVHPLKS